MLEAVEVLTGAAGADLIVAMVVVLVFSDNQESGEPIDDDIRSEKWDSPDN